MDVVAMWDFTQPAVSEQRFRAALQTAAGEDALVLRTQLGRALGLQGRFDECAAELDIVEQAAAAGDPAASPDVRTYLALERGRQLRSSGQAEPSRPQFLAALEQAQAAGLDYLAADAAHMLALIGNEEEQIEWAHRALEIALASADPKARHWVGSVANNLGWTLHTMGRFDQAQEQFERALRAREEEGAAEPVRIARWTVARGLRSLGRLDEALRIQTELKDAGPEDGYVDEELGELLLALDRADEARPHFARAHELLATDAQLAAAEPDRIVRLYTLSTTTTTLTPTP